MRAHVDAGERTSLNRHEIAVCVAGSQRNSLASDVTRGTDSRATDGARIAPGATTDEGAMDAITPGPVVSAVDEGISVAFRVARQTATGARAVAANEGAGGQFLWHFVARLTE
jgi:hypothetical protein